ncbi:hypothetical protein [Dysgonomonas termitidis]|uniref:Uncharacterized protein n=1 Tax=Dysgonomonas termitidis TaxID=1516126 RepID=A0ABV9KZ30_9BACT
MAGSERKKKLKGLFWDCSHLKQLSDVYSTSLQLILNRLWTAFPDNKKTNKCEFFDYNHYELLISSFNRSLKEKKQEIIDLGKDLDNAARKEMYKQKEIEKEISNILSRGKGLQQKITSNKKRRKRRARINSTCKLYTSLSKSIKKMTDGQESATYLFTEQVKNYFL